MTTEPSQTMTSPSPSLHLLEGSLNDQITQLERDAPRQGSEGFAQPGDQALTDFSQIIRDIFSGNLSSASQIAAKYHYELVIFKDDGNYESESYLLRELPPIQRGWGMYLIRPVACEQDKSSIVLEAPHTLSDEHTPQLALDAYRSLNGCALLIAGTHRQANNDGSADVAHNPHTVFQTFHLILAGMGGKSTLYMQIHGFAAQKHPGYPSVVLGGSPINDDRLLVLLNKMTVSFVSQDISAGICSETNWDDLCGETNIQATNMPSGLFIHLELNDAVRSDPKLLISSLVEALSKN